MTRRLMLYAPLALFVAFIAVVLFGLRQPQQQTIRSRMVGQPVPAFELAGLDATHPGLSDADLRQGTVTVVNLFASWCLPCRLEAGRLAKMAEKGVVVHGIATADKAQDVARFLKQYGNPYRRIGLDPDRKAAIALGSSGVPETFVIDGQGIIRHQHLGELREEDVPGLLREVEAAWR